MAKPLPEKISDELIVRLKNIKVSGGYEFSHAGVQLIDRDSNTWTPEVRKIYVEQGEANYNEELSLPGNPPRSCYDMQFEISGYASQLDREDSQVGVAETGVTDTQMIAAIKKAILNASPGSWHTFGGNAINARIISSTPFDDPEHDGGRVVLQVTYRHDEGDEFS